MRENLSWVSIAWAPYSRRSEAFAQELGVPLHSIHYLKFQAPLYAPPKYVLQAAKTLQVLFAERPRVVFAQNPPFVCGLVVSLYCGITGAQFILDHHSDAFSRRWRWALPVQKWLARRAAVNIVTDSHWADTIESWGAHALIMADPIVHLPDGEKYPVASGFSIAFVQTFAADEPLEEVLEAFSQLRDVHLYITGDTRRKPPAFFEKRPPHVTFTGFLPDGQYIGLLRAVDAVMALTTRGHTLQLGGCEAVAVGKPLIVSDWPLLRRIFSEGTVYVSNSAESIYRGVREMQQRQSELQQAMVAFRQDHQQQWRASFTQLRALMVSGSGG